MYLYDNEHLGDSRNLGPGIDPDGAQETMCPLLRHNGRDLEWRDYYIGRDKPPLSAYQKFLNEDVYRAYLESCKENSIRQLIKKLTGISFPPPKPKDPTVPTSLRMRK